MSDTTPAPPFAVPPLSALGGTLLRDLAQGWHWSDGTPEPRVRDMHLNDLAPSFRCASDYVEIPHDWHAAQYWPNGQIDNDARAAIQALLQEVDATEESIFAEGLAQLVDNHRLTQCGFRVAWGLWDATMSDVVGCWWDEEHEVAILSQAQLLADT